MAVFLHGMEDFWADARRMTPLDVEIIEDLGVVVHSFPFRAGSWVERTPLMREIRREGIDL